MELITISRLNSIRRCLRFHYLSYELKRRPIYTGEALGFGILFHDGQEAYWLAWEDIQSGRTSPDSIGPLEIALETMKLKYVGLEDSSGMTVFDLAKALELMRGYHYRWLDSMESMLVVGVESQFVTPLTNPLTERNSQTYRLGGKIDLRLKVLGQYNGESVSRAKIMEHKTTSTDISPDSDYWVKLRMDGQISQYLDGAKSLGDDVDGCIYDVARRPSQKPYIETPEEKKEYTLPKEARPGKPCLECKSTAKGLAKLAGEKLLVKDIPITEGCDQCTLPVPAQPPRLYSNMRDRDETLEEYQLRVRNDIAADPQKYFQRGEVVRLDEEVEEFRFDTWETAKMLRARQLASRTLGRLAWPRNPNACNDWFRTCEYYSVCTGCASIDNDHDFMDSKQHAELDDTTLSENREPVEQSIQEEADSETDYTS